MASHPGIVIRLLTWNLFHGRAWSPEPAGGRRLGGSLRRAFLAKLAGWEWDVALLQEAPPRWFDDLRQATGAEGWRVLTSRNWLGCARSAVARRDPYLLGSWEGGSNVVLVRPPARFVERGRLRLALLPERRVAALAKLELPGGRRLMVANAHLSVPATGRGAGEALRLAEVAARRAGGAPVVLGGDLNLRASEHPEAFAALRERFGLAAATGPRAIDHLLASGVEVVERPSRMPGAARELPAPGGPPLGLSDHAPVTAAFRLR